MKMEFDVKARNDIDRAAQLKIMREALTKIATAGKTTAKAQSTVAVGALCRVSRIDTDFLHDLEKSMETDK